MVPIVKLTHRGDMDFSAIPVDRKPTVPEVLPLIREYYAKDGNAVGGSLHIVLDDGNIDDSDVEFCRTFARENDDEDGILLAEILLRMSKTQRLELYCQH